MHFSNYQCRQNRDNKMTPNILPEPDLMDECANQEAPSISSNFKLIGLEEDKENTVSSGYVSEATHTLPTQQESTTGWTPFKRSLESTPKKSVNFDESIFPPALKKTHAAESPAPPSRQVFRELTQETLTQKELGGRPSLKRAVTLPNAAQSLKTDLPSTLSKSSVLPVVKTTTQGSDLISIHTVAQLVRGEYERLNITHTIVDCRYPYEYEAGHIRGAINLYTSSEVVKEIFKSAPAASYNDEEGLMDLGPSVDELIEGHNPAVKLPPVYNYHHLLENADDIDSEEEEQVVHNQDNFPIVPVPESRPNASKPVHVLIFHCEFSSQRGPELSRFLRKVDRYINYPRYPFVFYPHVYVMLGGYAAFHSRYPELCEPQSYLKMLEKGYKSELNYYSRVTKHVSKACHECFKQPDLINLQVSSSMSKEEARKPSLRPVKTMQQLSLESMSRNSPKKIEGVSRRYLQLAEHIIRKGSHIMDAYEYFREAGPDALAKETLMSFGAAPNDMGSPKPPTLGLGVSVKPRLSFSDDSEEMTTPKSASSPKIPPPNVDEPDDDRPRVQPVLDFSSINREDDSDSSQSL